MTERPNSVCRWKNVQGEECGQPEFDKNHFAFVGNIPIPGGHAFEPVAEPAEPSASPRKMVDVGGKEHDETPQCKYSDCKLAAPQPVAGLDPRPDLDWPLDAIRKNQPAQPVAGEGPSERPYENLCEALSDKSWLPFPGEGTPKLEEVDPRKAVEDWFNLPLHDLGFKHDGMCAEEGSTIIDARCVFCRVITAMAAYRQDSLRPFITPACAPAIDLNDVREDIGDAIQALRSGWPANDVIGILKECSESINVATPASTGEADGPEQPIYCGNCSSFKYEVFNTYLGVILRCLNCREQKLIELPDPAPTSVPQAEPPKKEKQ